MQDGAVTIRLLIHVSSTKHPLQTEVNILKSTSSYSKYHIIYYNSETRFKEESTQIISGLGQVLILGLHMVGVPLRMSPIS